MRIFEENVAFKYLQARSPNFRWNPPKFWTDRRTKNMHFSQESVHVVCTWARNVKFSPKSPKLWTKRRTEDNHSDIWEISAKYCTPINSKLSILYFNAVHFLGDFSEKLSFPRFVQSVLCWIHAFFGRFRRKNVLPQFIHMHFLGDFSENLCFCDCVLSFLFETCIFSEFSAKICLRKCAVGHFRKKYCFWIGNFLTYFPKKKKLPKFDSFSKKIWLFFGKFDGFERGKNHKVTWLIQK